MADNNVQTQSKIREWRKRRGKLLESGKRTNKISDCPKYRCLHPFLKNCSPEPQQDVYLSHSQSKAQNVWGVVSVWTDPWTALPTSPALLPLLASRQSWTEAHARRLFCFLPGHIVSSRQSLLYSSSWRRLIRWRQLGSGPWNQRGGRREPALGHCPLTRCSHIQQMDVIKYLQKAITLFSFLCISKGGKTPSNQDLISTSRPLSWLL